MGLVSLLFSFRGRINRLQYWLASLGAGVCAGLLAVLAFVIAMPEQPSDRIQAAQGALTLFALLGAIWLVTAWCGMAIQVKRFHDRGQSGLWSLLPIAPMAGMVLALAGAIATDQTAAQAGAAMQPYVLVLWAINLFFFINLGCLAGADGPNKYGPPPGSPPAPQTDPAPRMHAPAQAAFSLGSVEAAMERAIAEKSREAPAALKAAPAAAAPSSFGRRPAR